MSGMSDDQQRKEALDRVIEVLDRRSPSCGTSALKALGNAMAMPPREGPEIKRTAFAIDSGALLRMARDTKNYDVIDFLLTLDTPTVLPGQTLQEFWNNRLEYIHTIGSEFSKRFNPFHEYIRKSAGKFGTLEDDLNSWLNKIEEEFLHRYDDQTARSVTKLLSLLEGSILCDFAPREVLAHIAEQRKKTKTPPGFRDSADNYGDFYVWADTLYSLQIYTIAKGVVDFDQLILVSNDEKLDWVSQEIPHPALTSEVGSLFRVPFQVWTYEKLKSKTKI